MITERSCLGLGLLGFDICLCLLDLAFRFQVYRKLVGMFTLEGIVTAEGVARRQMVSGRSISIYIRVEWEIYGRV